MGRLGILSALGLALYVPAPASAMDGRIVGIASVADGGTLDIGPIRIRLHGIDAPEAGQTCKRAKGRSWQCGTEAMNRLAELVEDREVACMALDRDAYGRIVETCTAAGIDVNAALIDEGLAWAFLRYADDFVDHEAKPARQASASGRAKRKRHGTIAPIAGSVPPRKRHGPVARSRAISAARANASITRLVALVHAHENRRERRRALVLR